MNETAEKCSPARYARIVLKGATFDGKIRHCVMLWSTFCPIRNYYDDQGLLIDLFLQEIDYGTVSTQPAQHSPAGGSHQAQSSHMVLDRPLSSTASHSNSAHTNTSELSSGDTSSASSQKMDELHHHHLHHTPNKQIKRLADQPLERSRSPQSAYSAKLANKQTNSSVYYYSDTLKKEDKVNTRVTIDKKNNAQGSTLVWKPKFNL